MKDFLRHYFLPHYTNNHRAKLIHHDSLLFLLLGLLMIALGGISLQNSHPEILGAKTNISVEDLLTLTNKERQLHGVGPVTLNAALTEAAEKKAANMFAQNYWAHTAPDGTTPWVFIHATGYNYVYAGENLARGFSNAQSVMTAWMASPGHRENILSDNYQDIGFAVVPGKLLGDNTVLVVQMFGSTTAVKAPFVASPVPQAQRATVAVDGAAGVKGDTSPGTKLLSVASNPLVDRKSLFRVLAVFLLGTMIGVLLLDMLVVEKKKIVRGVSHHADHIIFFTILLILVLMIGKGLVL